MTDRAEAAKAAVVKALTELQLQKYMLLKSTGYGPDSSAGRLVIHRAVDELKVDPVTKKAAQSTLLNMTTAALQLQLTLLGQRGALCPRCEGPKQPAYYETDEPDADPLGRVLACEDCQPCAK